MGFYHLPVEIVSFIFELLDNQSKLQSRLVCKEWTCLLDSHNLAHNVVLRNKTFKYVKNLKSSSSCKHFKKLVVRGFSADISKLAKTKSRSPLALSPEKLVFERHRSRLPKTCLEENVSALIRLNPDISSLVFTPGSLNSIQSLRVRGLVLGHLKHLQISVSLYGDSESVLLETLTRIKMPSLTDLQLEAGIYNLNNFVNDQTFIELVKFLIAVRSGVKKLKLRHVLSSRFDWHLMLLPLTLARALPQAELDTLIDELASIQVEELSLMFIPRDGILDYGLGLELLRCQTNLKKFHMEIFPGRDSHDFKICTKSAILKNTETLQSLEVSCNGYGDRCWLLANYIDELWQALNYCRVLETLDLASFWIRRLLFPWPETIKHLMLGIIKPNILSDLKPALPRLETLLFNGFAHEDPPDFDSIPRHLLVLLSSRSLKMIKWRAEDENLDALNDNPELHILRSYELSRYDRKYDFITVTKIPIIP
ncbi:unnamed protein product [Allacma fusca]|uniref:F-box domain-containing protein n=1 Tax=Allacma fusca TaxID=39272 RepID=A0A8J2L4W9_9HEXA|nr:unnamed protein product [Allacma fusca]